MASESQASSKIELYDPSMTIPSDSENYSANNENSPSPPSSSSSPLVLYKPPTLWGVLRGAAINLILPFVNGLMLGFGELFAHEAAFRLGWTNTKVNYTFFLVYSYSVFCWASTSGRLYLFCFTTLLGLPYISTITSCWCWCWRTGASDGKEKFHKDSRSTE